jgi:hypothetical protein
MYNFWRSLQNFKDFCRNSIEISKGGPKETFLRNVSEFRPKNIPPLRILQENFSRGGLHPTCTHPLRNPGFNPFGFRSFGFRSFLLSPFLFSPF